MRRIIIKGFERETLIYGEGASNVLVIVPARFLRDRREFDVHRSTLSATSSLDLEKRSRVKILFQKLIIFLIAAIN